MTLRTMKPALTTDQKSIIDDVLARAARITFKFGTNSLIDVDDWFVKRRWLHQTLKHIIALDREFAIVSSGAIGMERVNRRGAQPLTVDEKQTFAGQGQIDLMRVYKYELARLARLRVAQVLLTRENLTNGVGLENSRDMLRATRADGAVAIINENDSVANEEIKFGDNDQLAAYAAHADDATTLVLVTDVNGLYTANPKTDKNARHIPVVECLTPAVMALGGGAVGHHSKGGMQTKLLAAFTAATYGVDTVILNGGDPRSITRFFMHGDVAAATVIPAEAHPQQALF